MVYTGEGLCSIARETYGPDMVYIYITAWNERTDGNSMGLTTWAIMYNQRVIIYATNANHHANSAHEH